MVGFLMWFCVGCLFLLLGLWAWRSRKAVCFWANIETVPMKDVKAYNRAMGKLWVVYGIVFIFLGVPLLTGNPLGIMITILGTLAECIGAMAVYLLVIQNKYERK